MKNTFFAVALVAILAASCLPTEPNPAYCDGDLCAKIDGGAGETGGAGGGGSGGSGGQDGPFAMDVRPADGSGTCGADGDCPAELPLCLGSRCARCAGNADCAGRAGTPVCHAATGRCVGCVADGDCSGTKPVCDKARNECAACASRAQCAAKSAALPACRSDGSCVQCTATTDCSAADAPICNTSANTCAPCSIDSQCEAKSPATKGCASGRCVACSKSEHCGAGAQPVCVANACTACTGDAQCAAKTDLGPNPGVCMFHQDGRCATDAEAIYVENRAGCAMAGAGGTAAMPYCQAQTGVDAAAMSPARRLVVLRGPAGQVGFSASVAGQLSVVGQNGAFLAPGAAGPGIRVSTGDLYIRGLTVRNSEDTGIVVEAAGTLRMNRCIVKDNMKGGLLVNPGAAFDIANCAFDNNGPGIGSFGAFGGVSLGAARMAGPARFWNNTIVNNKAQGVVCERAMQPVTGVLVYQNAGGDTVNCTVGASKTTADGDPKLGADYRLTAASPCRNAGDMTNFPADDLDGDVRPQEGRSDCGADELKP